MWISFSSSPAWNQSPSASTDCEIAIPRTATKVSCWTDGRVRSSNGASLNVQNSLGYPEEGPGSNMQGLTMWCSGDGGGAMIRHSDQYRGME